MSCTDAQGDGFEYLGSLVCRRQDGVLRLESTSFTGGRFVAANSGAGRPIPHYFVTDHLGSTRVVVDSCGVVRERSDYYPFGMRWATPSQEISDNRFRYNGKEGQILAKTGWLDYGARSYDPETGRWFVQDPLAEAKYNFTPYHFNQNNPINRIDIDGNIDWPLAGIRAVNKIDYPDGAWSLNNTVVRTSLYNEERNIGTSPHIGIDYRANIGTPVYSLGDGVVNQISTTNNGINYIVIEYGNGDKLRFMHMNSIANDLKPGSQVYEGQVIRESGNSGMYRNNGKYVNYQAHLHVDAMDKNGNQISPEASNYGLMDSKSFFEKYDGNYRKLRDAKKEAIYQLYESAFEESGPDDY